VIRAVLDRSVLLLAAFAVVAFALLWRLISWNVEATRIEGVTIDTSQDQRALALMFILPYLLSPAAATMLVAALIGLPIVIGARYAAIVRARRTAGSATP
jgi:hypothetical protein